MHHIMRREEGVWYQEEGGRSAAKSLGMKMRCEKRKEEGMW